MRYSREKTIGHFRSQYGCGVVMKWFKAGVAKLLGPWAIFRNLDEGAGHTT